MEHYTPFNRGIAQLEASDLSVLRNVHEGWYVEYKRELVRPRALAKTVAAFANTYGGWLFLGIEERSSEANSARAFPGMDAESATQTTEWLRQSLAEYVTPVPYYQWTAVHGPCDEIDLAEGHSIIVVKVPQSATAPHVHKDGRIYIRVADSSEPRYVNDRFVLDQLEQRSNRLRSSIAEWIDSDPEFSKEETDHPYLRLMFSPDLWQKQLKVQGLRLTDLREALTGDPTREAILPLDAIYPTGDGFIARQVSNNDPSRYTLTFHVYGDYSCDVIVPLRYYSGAGTTLAEQLGSHYRYVDRFLKILVAQRFLNDDNISDLNVVDLNILFYLLLGVTRQYRAILGLSGAVPEFYFKARILHCWRRIAYMDVEPVLERFTTSGIPLLMNDVVMVPPGYSPDSFVLLKNKEIGDARPEGPLDPIILQAVPMFIEILAAFGIAGLMASGDGFDIQEIVAAGNRGMSAMRSQ